MSVALYEQLLKEGKLETLLDALQSSPNITEACERAGIPRGSLYKALGQSEEFKAAFEEARAIGLKSVEDELIRRAQRGVQEPVFHQGQQVATVTKYSDTLLMFYLKGQMPQTYRDNARLEVSGPNGGPIQQSINIDLGRLSLEQLRQLEAMRDSLEAPNSPENALPE